MPGTPVFVDTNVLLYASRPKANEHARSQAALSRMRQDGAPLWLSRQVFREYLAAATRPQASGPALPMAAAIADVHGFRPRSTSRRTVRTSSIGCCSCLRPTRAGASKCTTPIWWPPCWNTASVAC